MKFFLVMLIMGLVINITGCGQKGDLIQPTSVPEQPISLEELTKNKEHLNK